jgi:hypothetical protein
MCAAMTTTSSSVQHHHQQQFDLRSSVVGTGIPRGIGTISLDRSGFVCCSWPCCHNGARPPSIRERCSVGRGLAFQDLYRDDEWEAWITRLDEVLKKHDKTVCPAMLCLCTGIFSQSYSQTMAEGT